MCATTSETKGWRLTLRLKVKDPSKSTELRAALVNGDKTLSETWSYRATCQ
jgi:periplasmic glucans biosynthesis protein